MPDPAATTPQTEDAGRDATTPGGPEAPAGSPVPHSSQWAPVRQRWERVPLRVRLVGILVVLLVAALAATGAGTTWVLRNYLIHQVDDKLTSSVPQVLRSVSVDQNMGGGPQPLAQYALRFSYDDGTPPSSQVVGVDSEPDLDQLTRAQAAAKGNKPFTVGSVDGSQQWRVIALAVPSDLGKFANGETGSIQIALPLSGVSDAIGREILLVIGFGLLMTALASLLGWLAIRRAFVPLTEVEQTAAAIAAGDLSRRVPNHPASTEVGRLTSALNGMLAQIESAFRSREASEQRTRRFAADASHELRTPLASIRGFAELYRQGAVREPDDVARVMSRIEGESKRMGTLVEDLLLLARLDEQRPARTDPVDLAVLAGDATHDARGLAPDRQVRLVGLSPERGPESTVVIGDENRLRQVVANLVGNAVRHTPEGTPVEVAVGRQDGVAVLEIRDHGPGLPPEHAARVFERFYRVDSSRTRGQGGGSGLGLSIVAAVVNSHGGRVGVAQTAGGGATFRVELPLARDLPELDEPEDVGADDEALDLSEPST